MCSFILFFFKLMVICYGLIIWKLSTTRVKTANPTLSFTTGNIVSVSKFQNQRNLLSRSQIDRRRVTIMCAALVMCFVICWLPFHAVHLAKISKISDIKVSFVKIIL